MYAKLENNKLIPAPHEIIADEFRIFNPSHEQLREMGYKAVVYSEAELSEDMRPAAESAKASMREVYNQDDTHIYVSYVPTEPVPAPAPAMLREQAYRVEADQYLIAAEGYRLELEQAEASGDEARAALLYDKQEAQRTRYLATKAAIREQYADNE